jgi:hypothetical protein
VFFERFGCWGDGDLLDEVQEVIAEEAWFFLGSGAGRAAAEDRAPELALLIW